MVIDREFYEKLEKSHLIKLIPYTGTARVGYFDYLV